MNSRILLILLLVACSCLSKANEGEYAANKIAPALKKNAHAVVRYSSNEYTIGANGDFIRHIKSVVTVLDAQGEILGFQGRLQRGHTSQQRTGKIVERRWRSGEKDEKIGTYGYFSHSSQP